MLRKDVKLPAKAGAPDWHRRRDRRQPRDMGADSLLRNRLIRLVEGSIARIQLQRTSHSAGQRGPAPGMVATRPADPAARARPTRRCCVSSVTTPAKADGMASTWAVNLALPVRPIGTLQCRIALAGEHVSATFWCERSATGQHGKSDCRFCTPFEAQGLQDDPLAGASVRHRNR